MLIVLIGPNVDRINDGINYCLLIDYIKDTTTILNIVYCSIGIWWAHNDRSLVCNTHPKHSVDIARIDSSGIIPHTIVYHLLVTSLVNFFSLSFFCINFHSECSVVELGLFHLIIFLYLFHFVRFTYLIPSLLKLF